MEQNKIIALFMGLSEGKPNESRWKKDWFTANGVRHTHLEYHESWDALMPVVKECYDNGAEGDEIGDITHALLDCDRDATYKAVVKFINQLKTN